MRRHLAVAALAASAGLALVAEGVAAQLVTPEAVISVSAGIGLPRAYWRLDAQPVTAGGGFAALDTLALAQRLVAGPFLAVSATRFTGPSLGIGVEGYVLVAHAETSCRMRGAPASDPAQLTTQICNTLQGLRLSHSAIGIQGALTLRPPRVADLRPFARIGAGLVAMGRGLYYLRIPIWTAGCEGCLRTIMDAPVTSLTWAASLAAGATLGSGHGGRFRAEVRDAIVFLPTVTGPANPYGESPLPATRRRAVHRLLLLVGADLVFGGPRGRRY